MSDRLRALREERAREIAELRAITDAAEKEKRTLSDEEDARHRRIFSRCDELRRTIEAEERTVEMERTLAAAASAATPAASDAAPPTAMTGFRQYLLGNGIAGPEASELRALQTRALSAGVAAQGGFLVAPEEFVRTLIKAVDDLAWIRALATVYPIPMAASLGAVSLDADPSDADWTSEIKTGSEDNAMAFGKRELAPKPLAKRIKVSERLLRMSVLPVETLVTTRLAYKFAITEEKAFLTGSGANQPLGVFTASADGVPTSRDVSTGNTTTAITFDGLISAKYELKAPYRSGPSLRWLFHRDAIEQIAKLKDGQNQYLWMPSVRDGEPDRILGIPVAESEYVPNTFTSGLYVGMLADFSHYWIADSLAMTMKRLDELYAETAQVGFIGRLETDGMPVLAEAFVRVKLA